MTDTKVADSLTDHFTRTWDMLLEAASHFPEKNWYESQDERMQPARIVYHILMGTDRYTWLGAADDYASKRQFSLDWMKAPVQEFPCQKDALKHLEDAKAKTLAWIQHFGPSGLVSDKPLWPWTGSCVLAQGLYHLRHVQHHLAELNVELRQRGLPDVEWK